MRARHLAYVFVAGMIASGVAGGYPVRLTPVEDTIVRCVVGECRDPGSYAFEPDAFDGAVFGTDLGICASDGASTYLFLGDTYCPDPWDPTLRIPCPADVSDPDAYLVVPETDFERFIVTSDASILGDVSSYVPAGVPPDPFEYVRDIVPGGIIGPRPAKGFNVPTGALVADGMPVVFYALGLGGFYDDTAEPDSVCACLQSTYPDLRCENDNSDVSTLLAMDASGTRPVWRGHLFPPKSGGGFATLSEGPGGSSWRDWCREHDPAAGCDCSSGCFAGGKFISVAAVAINTGPGTSVPLGGWGICRPPSEEPAALLFGTGKYRDSAVYLGWVPLESIADRTAYRFFRGWVPGSSGPSPCWSASQEEAVAVALEAYANPEPDGRVTTSGDPCTAVSTRRGAGEISVTMIRVDGEPVFVMGYTGLLDRLEGVVSHPAIDFMYTENGLPWEWTELEMWSDWDPLDPCGSGIFELACYEPGVPQSAYGPYFAHGIVESSTGTGGRERISLYHTASTWRGGFMRAPYGVESRRLTLERQPSFRTDESFIVDLEPGLLASALDPILLDRTAHVGDDGPVPTVMHLVDGPGVGEIDDVESGARHLVALGPFTDDAALHERAWLSGGTFHKSWSERDLPEVLQAARDDVHGLSALEVRVEDGSRAFRVAPADGAITVRFSRDAGSASAGHRIVLVSPPNMFGDRRIISGGDVDVEWVRSADAIAVRIVQPRAGWWRVVEFDGWLPVVPPPGSERAATVSAEGGIRLESRATCARCSAGRDVDILVTLDDGWGGIRGSRLEVETWRDGAPLDAAIEIGRVDEHVHRVTLLSPAQGTYTFRITASFSMNGRSFERTDRLSLPIVPHTASTGATAAGMQGGLACAVHGRTIDVLDLHANDSPIGRTDLGSIGRAAAISGNHVFVATLAGIVVIDATDPGSPFVVRVIPTRFPVVALEASDGFLFAVDGTGLSVHDVMDPSSPRLLASVRLFECEWPLVCFLKAVFGAAHPMDVRQGRVAVADGRSLVVLDLEDPAVPSVIARHDTPGRITAVDLFEEYARVSGEGFDMFVNVGGAHGEKRGDGDAGPGV